MKLLLSPLRGNERLWKVFWIYNFLFGIILNIVLEVLDYLAVLSILYLFLIIVIFWTIWVVTGLWKCAFNVNWKGWGYLTRIFVVLAILGLIIGLWQMRSFIYYQFNIIFLI